MPVKSALEAIRSDVAESPAAILGNRLMSGASTVAIGGSIAALVTHYCHVPEELHAHVVAIVIFGWQSLVYGVSWYLARK